MSRTHTDSSSLLHEVRFTQEIALPAEQAWKVLVNEVQSWWPADFHAVAPESRIALDCRMGGLLAETTEDGNGIVWYQVIALDAPSSLVLSGKIAPPWGGPAVSLLRLALSKRSDSSSTLEIHDSILGRADVQSVESGWRTIFESFSTVAARKSR